MINKSKRILFISDFLHAGGAEVIFRHNIEIAKRLGHNVETLIGYTDYRIYGIFSGIKYLILSPIIFLCKAIKFKPDTIHLYSYYHVFTPSILIGIFIYKLFKRKIKVIYSAHDMHIFTPNPGAFYVKNNKIYKVDYYPSLKQSLLIQWNTRRGKDLKGKIISLLARQLPWIYFYKILKLHKVLDLITVPSLFLKELLEKIPNLNIPIVLWRNPMNLSMFDNIAKNKTKKQFPYIDLVYIGRIDADKGLLEIIKLLKQIKKPAWHLTFIGDGPDLERIKNLVSKYKLKQKITILGRLPYEKAVEELAKHEVLIMGSHWWENAPLTIVEAALLNIKVLTRPHGGMKELATLVGNNYFFELNKKSLQDALVRIRNNDPENESISRRKLKEIFSEKEFIKKLKEIY